MLSVHSVVSFDFAVSQLPGWHTTIFPPYFVAGAIYGGFAMVLCLAVPAREYFGLKDIITKRHIDNMGKIMLATGMMVGYSYLMEVLHRLRTAATPHEQFTFIEPRLRSLWLERGAIMIFCNVHRAADCSGPRKCRTEHARAVDRRRCAATWACGSSGSRSSSRR